MLKKLLIISLMAVFVIGCAFAVDEAGMPTTLAEKFSYALGFYLASTYGTDSAMQYFYMYQYYYWPEINENLGSMGVYSYAQGIMLYEVDELNSILSEYPAEYAARVQAQAVENLATAEAFLAENAKAEGIQVTKSGLQYKIIKQGTGAKAAAEDSVELDYELKLLDGTVVDSSYARGEHSVFPMSGVIEGFKEGVMLMPMGSHYIFYIHPDLGYGSQATGSMGPNSLLIFEVETYSISEK
jgi:FKBP-type peptidyl-prolyl cis-trans isomerase